MSNSFTLRDGQTVAIDFAQEPNLGDFAKLIALLELQRSFLDGSPAPQVVVDVRSAGTPFMSLHESECGYTTGRVVGLVHEKDCLPASQTIVDDPPDADEDLPV